MTREEYEVNKRKKLEQQQKLINSNFSPKQYIQNLTGKKTFAWAEEDINTPYVPENPKEPSRATASYEPTPKKFLKGRKNDPCKRKKTKPQVVSGRKSTPVRDSSPIPSTSTGITHSCIPPYLYNVTSHTYRKEMSDLAQELQLSSDSEDDTDSSSSSSSSSSTTSSDSDSDDPLAAFLLDAEKQLSPMISPIVTPVLPPLMPSYVRPSGFNAEELLDLAIWQLQSEKDQEDYQLNPHKWFTLDEC